MLSVTFIVDVPLPFTTSIVAPVKSNSSPYLYTVLFGLLFIVNDVTVSFISTLYVVVAVFPFSVYVTVNGKLAFSTAELNPVTTAFVNPITSGVPTALVTSISPAVLYPSLTLYNV